MLSRWARRWSSQFFHPLVALLLGWGVTANQLTVLGLVLAVPCGFWIATGRWVLAALVLLLAGLFDALDGELARTRQKAGLEPPGIPLGAFIDSVADHYGDFALYLGAAWWAVQRGETPVIFLVLAAMFGSLAGSHIRSRAGMIGIDTKNVGSFTRLERTLAWLFSLLSGWLALALAILALFGNLSALQRVVYTLQAGREAQEKQTGLK